MSRTTNIPTRIYSVDIFANTIFNLFHKNSTTEFQPHDVIWLVSHSEAQLDHAESQRFHFCIRLFLSRPAVPAKTKTQTIKPNYEYKRADAPPWHLLGAIWSWRQPRKCQQNRCTFNSNIERSDRQKNIESKSSNG